MEIKDLKERLDILEVAETLGIRAALEDLIEAINELLP